MPFRRIHDNKFIEHVARHKKCHHLNNGRFAACISCLWDLWRKSDISTLGYSKRNAKCKMQIVRMLLLSLFCHPKHEEGTNRRDGRGLLLSFCQQTTMCLCWLKKRNTSLFSENSGLFGYKIPKHVILKRRFSAQQWCYSYCSWQVPQSLCSTFGITSRRFVKRLPSIYSPSE